MLRALVLSSVLSWFSLKAQIEHIDYCIIGAGAAGLQLGYFFQQKGLNYRIFERQSIAGDETFKAALYLFKFQLHFGRSILEVVV